MTEQHLRWCGYAIMAASAVLTFAFARTFAQDSLQGIMLPIGLVAMALASSLMWPRIYDRWRRGDTRGIIVPIAIGVLFTGADLTSNFGSLSWQRGADLKQAEHQDAKHTAYNHKHAEAQKNLEMARKRLATIEAKNGWLAEGGGDIEQLKLNIADVEAKADREAERGGCGPKCERIKRQVVLMRSNLALAIQHKQAQDMKQAAIRWLENAEVQVAETPKARSAVALQNASLASIFELSLNPSVDARHWTDKGIGWLIALVFTFGGMGCFIAAQMQVEGRQPRQVRQEPKDAPVAPLSAPAASTSTVVVKDSTDLWQTLDRLINGSSQNSSASLTPA